MLDRRQVLKVAAMLGVGGLAGAVEPGAPGLYRVVESATLLAAMKMLLVEDAIGTLITVDAEGQPRARSVVVSRPEADLTLWIGTRPGSRKLEQIERNPRVTLHFAVDGKVAYASLMGRAKVYRDKQMAAAKSPFDEAGRRRFFPQFPEDFVLIGFKPEWLEVVADGVAAKDDTWQPQGMRV